MTYDNWVQSNLGKGIDYDGAYGVQCVDLAKHFIKNVLEFTPQSIGNAIEYYNKRNTSPYLKNHFKWIDNATSFIPAKGDLCVFTSKSGFGHISVATGEGNTSYFYSYDQNYPRGKHEPMTKIKHTYNSFLGVLRPYNQSNIVANGWRMEDGEWYYLVDGNVAKGLWVQDSNGWLYLDDNGRIATNQWRKDSTGWLYLGENGHPIANQWKQDSVGWCYLDSDGYMKTNAWQQDSKGWCFIKDDGHLLYDGYAWDNTGKHYLDKTGHMEW